MFKLAPQLSGKAQQAYVAMVLQSRATTTESGRRSCYGMTSIRRATDSGLGRQRGRKVRQTES